MYMKIFSMIRVDTNKAMQLFIQKRYEFGNLYPPITSVKLIVLQYHSYNIYIFKANL